MCNLHRLQNLLSEDLFPCQTACTSAMLLYAQLPAGIQVLWLYEYGLQWDDQYLLPC